MSAPNAAVQGVKPLQQNNSQTPGLQGKKMIVKKVLNGGSKVTARADSTGLENDLNQIVKHHHSVKKMQTPSVARRNARERNRVKGVNDGFGFLKKHVPNMKSKSSKVETLRGAIEYIKELRRVLGEDIEDFKNSTFEFKMESGDDDDDNSNFSELTTEQSPENSSPETSLRELSALHPMVYQLPVSSPYRPTSLLTPTTCSLLVSPDAGSLTHLVVSTALEPSPKQLDSPPTNANGPLEKLPSISTTMWWPLPQPK